MSNNQTFADGFVAGLVSEFGPRLIIPEIPAPPIKRIGSDYIHGLMAGIEAAKTKKLEMASENSN